MTKPIARDPIYRRRGHKQTPLRFDGRFQVVRQCRHYHCRNRVGTSYSQTAILIRRRPTAPRAVLKDAVGSGARVRGSIARHHYDCFARRNLRFKIVKRHPTCTRTVQQIDEVIVS
jgi:hypothetical protein